MCKVYHEACVLIQQAAERHVTIPSEQILYRRGGVRLRVESGSVDFSMARHKT